MMSSWVQLLLALLAACPRCAAAEGDVLPAALVELVRSSPIASIEDLQLLLLTDSVDEEDEPSAASGGHRLPRSLDVQPAQQALCKVRTEVVEVTRAMLDRSNANFLLWPPCIEVQRCSGCCNAKSLQCVPFVTHTKHLQVMKIEYINKRPSYTKAEVSVVDHVECRCQPAPRPSAPRKKSSRRQNIHLHPNQTLVQGHSQGQARGHSKDELHQWDELKHNQGVHLEELLEQHWNPRGDTFTRADEHYRLSQEGAARSGDAVLFAPHWSHNSSRLPATEVQTEKQDNVERRDGGVPDENRTVPSVDDAGVEERWKMEEDGAASLLSSTAGVLKERREDPQTHSPLWREEKSKTTKSHTSGFSRRVTSDPPANSSPTAEPSARPRPTKEPHPDPPGQARRGENETPEERILRIEERKLEEEKKELLLLHKRLDQEKEMLRQQQMKREEEERQREEEMESGRQLRGQHHHRLQAPTQRAETTTSTTTTRRPPAAAGPRHAGRPKQPRKRMRKNRRRISKAAMRAMLM